MRVKRIHHLTLAVRDVEGARATFTGLFGVPAGNPRALRTLGVRASEIPLGDVVLQLVTPASNDNPVQRFLERKGEGLYNIAFEVDDLDIAVAELISQGVRVSEPIEVEPEMRAAFITMAATHGLSIQLVEIAGERAAVEPSIAPVTLVDEPRAEHLPEDAPTPIGSEGATPRTIDLTPDEWSDTD